MTTLALIGAGRWGSNIQRTLSTFPEVNLKYVETHNWRRLLRVDDLDGVLIATPATTHAALASPFITRNIPVFIEKPLTASLPEAVKLLKLVKLRRAIAMVGHVHLYSPAFEVAARAIRAAGRIRYVLAEGMNNGPYRNDISCLWDWAPHDLAMALQVLGAEPTSVSVSAVSLLRPRTRLYDVANLHLTFPQHIEFFGMYSWLSPEKRKKFTVVCERDTVVYDDTAQRKVTVYRGLGPHVRGNHLARREPRITHPAYSPEQSLAQELRAFVRAIRTGTPTRSDIFQGVATIRILDAAERSIRRDGSVVRR